MENIRSVLPSKDLFFKVLVVEDCKVSIEKIKRKVMPILEQSGRSYSFTHCVTGDEGWQSCRDCPYNFYVIDGQTPGDLQGGDVCKKIIKQDPNANVVLYSAMEEKEVAALNLPASVKVIKKQIIELEDTLNRALDSSDIRKSPSPYSKRKNSSDTKND